MPATMTKRLRAYLTEQLYEAFDETAPSRMYIFFGRTLRWPDENNPPQPIDAAQDEWSPWRTMLAMKRVQPSDRSYVVPRYDWTTGTVYTMWDDSSDLAGLQFYVVVDNANVYTCIDNNRGAQSTTRPTGTSAAIITTADGYRWKYLFTISGAVALKFMTDNYVPVTTLTANDGSSQWTVQQAAVNGAISVVKVTANGTGYISTANTFQSVTNSTMVVLKSNALAVDGAYVKSTIFTTSGTGSGQLKRITNYVGATRTATVNNAYTTLPDTSTGYQVAPNVLIRGDGVGQATAYVSTLAAGQIKTVTIINTGTNYSTANVSISANTTYGTGATARAILPPLGGYGADLVAELQGHNLMLNVKVAGSESNTMTTNNDFRVIGLLANPRLHDGTAANASVIDATTSLSITGASGNFTADELIRGSTSLATGRLVWFANTNAAHTQGVLHMTNVVPAGTGVNFVNGETLTGNTSGKTATLTTRTNPAVRAYTGEVLYVSNRSPIGRASNQTEDIKIVILL